MSPRSVVQFVFIALAAAITAAVAGFVAYVLLLPDFTQRAPTINSEPLWLLPTTIGVALVLGSFVAQRCLDWGPYGVSRLAPSMALGALIGVLLNLAWSVRLLVSHSSMEDLVHAWSCIPLTAAIAGTLVGHLLHKR